MTGYLLDTDAVLILAFWPERASRRTQRLSSSGRRCVSPVSAFEMAVKRAIGKLTLPPAFQLSFRYGFEEMLRELSADLLAIELEHIDTLSRLPLIHRDPFDRLLISQALQEDLTIVSGDRAFAAYPGLSVLEI